MSPRTCDRPTGVLVPGELRRGEKLIYGRCVEEAGESTDTATDATEDLAVRPRRPVPVSVSEAAGRG